MTTLVWITATRPVLQKVFDSVSKFHENFSSQQTARNCKSKELGKLSWNICHSGNSPSREEPTFQFCGNIFAAKENCILDSSESK